MLGRYNASCVGTSKTRRLEGRSGFPHKKQMNGQTKWTAMVLILTQYSPLLLSIPPENIRKPKFSGGIENQHWALMVNHDIKWGSVINIPSLNESKILKARLLWFKVSHTKDFISGCSKHDKAYVSIKKLIPDKNKF